MKKPPLVRIGLVVAFAPLILSFVTSIFQGGSMWDEGSGTGAYLWFMLLTLPLGFVIMLVGLILLIARRRPAK